jgi:hypothetical protein
MDVAEFAETVLVRVFGNGMSRRCHGEVRIREARPLKEIFEQVQRESVRREALLDRITNECLPLTLDITAPVMHRSTIDALAINETLWNQWLSQEAGVDATKRIDPSSPAGTELVRVFYYTLASSDRLREELRIAAPLMGPDVLRYAEAVCGPNRSRAHIARMAELFEAGDTTALDRWIRSDLRNPTSFRGSTVAWWARSDGFRPGNLVRTTLTSEREGTLDCLERA